MSRSARSLMCLLAVSLYGCTGGEVGDSAHETERVRPQRIVAGSYAAEDGVLYRIVEGTAQIVAVLPAARQPGADTLEECASAIPELGDVRFDRLQAAPDSAQAAWRTGGPGACVGVVGTGEPAVKVVGYWSAAYPDSLVWAPLGRYLAVWLTHPSGGRSLIVYDALAGLTLEMPWDAECSTRAECDVAGVKWLGGSLLNVEIRLGPAERSVPYEVNVASAGPAEVNEGS